MTRLQFSLQKKIVSQSILIRIDSKQLGIMMINKILKLKKRLGEILGEIQNNMGFVQIPKTWHYTHGEDTASMALPSGHAASTACSPYFTFFTNVIVCDGFNPAHNKKKS